MTSLDELRAAIRVERQWNPLPFTPERKNRGLTDVALDRVEDEIAALRKRPTFEQIIEAMGGADVRFVKHGNGWYMGVRSVVSAIRALYGEAES